MSNHFAHQSHSFVNYPTERWQMFAKAQVDLPPPQPSQRQIFQIFAGMCAIERVDAEAFLRVARGYLNSVICGETQPVPSAAAVTADAAEEATIFNRLDVSYTCALHTFSPAGAPVAAVLLELDQRGFGIGLTSAWELVTVRSSEFLLCFN